MSQIVITGSTGVIGRRAVRELVAASHRVTGVARSARGRERLASLGASAVEAGVFDEASLRRAFDGADAVVNLLTHIPSIDRMGDPAAWEENDRLRTEASAAVARAAQAAGAQRATTSPGAALRVPAVHAADRQTPEARRSCDVLARRRDASGPGSLSRPRAATPAGSDLRRHSATGIAASGTD